MKYAFVMSLICLSCLGAGIMPPLLPKSSPAMLKHRAAIQAKHQMVPLVGLLVKAVRAEATTKAVAQVAAAKPKTLTLTWDCNYDTAAEVTVVESTPSLAQPKWTPRFIGSTNVFLLFPTNQTEFFRVFNSNSVTGARSVYCKNYAGYVNVAMRY